MRLLLVKTRLPYPIRAGQDLVDYALLRALAERHEVTLVAPTFDDCDAEEAIPELAKYCRTIITVPFPKERTFHGRFLARMRGEARFWLMATPLEVSTLTSPRMKATLANTVRKGEFDFIEVSFWHLGQYISDLGGILPTILLQHSTLGETRRREALIKSRPLRHRIRHWFYANTAMAQYETRICQRFDRVLFISAADRAAFQNCASIMERSDIVPVPYCIPLGPGLVTPVESSSLVFLGGMHTPYNIESLRFFTQAVLPIVAQSVPAFCLTVVGNPPTSAALGQFKNPHIKFVGFQQDVRSYIRQHSVFIAPVVTGTGIRTKIIEALAQGMPIVSTAMGVEGLTLEVGKDILVGDTPEDFARHIVDLLSDSDLRTRLGQAALERFRVSYEFESVKTQTMQTYDRVFSELADQRHKGFLRD